MSEQPVASPVAGLRLAGNTIVAAVFGSLYLLGAARLLGPLEFSDLAVCLSMSAVGLLFLGPLNLTLIRFSATYQDSKDEAQIRLLLRKTGRLYAPWVGGVIAVLILFETPIAGALNIRTANLVPWTGVLVGLGLALGAVRAVALGLHQHRLYSRSILFEAVLRLAVGGALVLIYGNVGAALSGFVQAAAITLLLFGVLIWRRLPAEGRHFAEADDVLRFMGRALVFSAILSALQNVDMIIAKARLDAAGAGDYAIALSLARGFILVAAPFAAMALARPAPKSVVTFAVISAPAIGVLFLAPGPILTLLFGGHTASQAQLLPLLSLAFAAAGIFMIVSHAEIRAGRFGFLVPVGATLAAEILVLWFVPASALTVAWIVLASHVLSIACVLATPLLFARVRPFEGSAKYWDDRYAQGGFSGAGSVGKFAAFKADVLNGFVRRHGVRSVIEFGCGDGQQLSLAEYPRYLGFDVSSEAVRLCRTRFDGDDSKTFRAVADYSGDKAELALSLDVIYHLVEDEVFENYMRLLFDASERWVIVYASNHDGTDRAEAAHVRHRQFTRWVEANRPEWVLRETIPNRYPYTGDYRLGSFSDFFIFERA